MYGLVRKVVKISSIKANQEGVMQSIEKKLLAFLFKLMLIQQNKSTAGILQSITEKKGGTRKYMKIKLMMTLAEFGAV